MKLEIEMNGETYSWKSDYDDHTIYDIAEKFKGLLVSADFILIMLMIYLKKVLLEVGSYQVIKICMQKNLKTNMIFLIMKLILLLKV